MGCQVQCEAGDERDQLNLPIDLLLRRSQGAVYSSERLGREYKIRLGEVVKGRVVFDMVHIAVHCAQLSCEGTKASQLGRSGQVGCPGPGPPAGASTES